MRDDQVTEDGAGAAGRVGGPADGQGIETQAGRRAKADPLLQVRASDVEPYTGLGYLSRLFRIIAVLLLVLLLVEVATGLYTSGRQAVPTLLSESSRLVVLAGLLWGIGDLATLLIDVGHDVRATRILIGRQAAHHVLEHHSGEHAAEHAADRSARDLVESQAGSAAEVRGAPHPLG
jgi:hypothetical protein